VSRIGWAIVPTGRGIAACGKIRPATTVWWEQAPYRRFTVGDERDRFKATDEPDVEAHAHAHKAVPDEPDKDAGDDDDGPDVEAHAHAHK
jgi:hypothetical protein